MYLIRFIVLSGLLGVIPGRFSFCQNKISIGLLIPDKTSEAAVNGARLAITEANEQKRNKEKTFQLVVRSTEGLWGSGSKQSVSLVFDSRVSAILGSLDGRNAHLAEQVATKTKVAFLASRATDMSLSYAFVPWFFRCIPDDMEQAVALVHEIYDIRKLTDVTLIGTTEYDAVHAMTSFVKVTGAKHSAEPVIYSSGTDTPHKDMLQSILNGKPEAIVLFGDPVFTASWIRRLYEYNIHVPLFGTLASISWMKHGNPAWESLNDLIVISPGYLFSEKGKSFIRDFRASFGYEPGPVAAFSYDGTNMLIAAIRKAGPERDKVITTLTNIDFKGITGEIIPDKRGNRTGTPAMMMIRNGIPVPLVNKR